MGSADQLEVRPYSPSDEQDVIDLWSECGLVKPWNNPRRDIERKLLVNPEWFLVGVVEGRVVASCMAGYEGHRGWINYLAVSPSFRRRGIATAMMAEAEMRLTAAGCPKINLQVRESNQPVTQFYRSIGFSDDHVVSMGKRLEPEHPYDPEATETHQDADVVAEV
jgi:ribosomal protein S18 acetylase RimI-like enzyme